MGQDPALPHPHPQLGSVLEPQQDRRSWVAPEENWHGGGGYDFPARGWDDDLKVTSLACLPRQGELLCWALREKRCFFLYFLASQESASPYPQQIPSTSFFSLMYAHACAYLCAHMSMCV